MTANNTKNDMQDIVREIRTALTEDVNYYGKMGQRGPVIHTIVDYETIVVSKDTDYDIIRAYDEDTCELYELSDAIATIRDELDDIDQDIRLCEKITSIYPGFSRTGDNPWEHTIENPDTIGSDRFEQIIDALNDANYGELSAMYMRLVPVVDRNAQFLTHAEAAKYLASGSYSQRAHTYCCHIPDDSLLARLLEAIGPVHH